MKEVVISERLEIDEVKPEVKYVMKINNKPRR
jgi:hypothetical protein